VRLNASISGNNDTASLAAFRWDLLIAAVEVSAFDPMERSSLSI
jgi:hypothetical protein